MKQFVLIVKYGTGKAAMLTDTPDMMLALEKFREARLKEMPDSKYFGLSEIRSAEILPLFYESIYVYKDKKEGK